MINIYVVLFILFVHWIADFVCQSQQISIDKSKSWSALLEHTFIYSVIWIVPIVFINIFFHLHPQLIWFIPITFLTHTATDFYTSRVNSMYYGSGKMHEFFVSIGFDQWLHYTQLLLTFYFLTK